MAGGASPARPGRTAGRAPRPRVVLLFRAAARLGALGLLTPHFWLVAGMVVIGAVLHYMAPLPFLSSVDTPLQLTRHNMNRILFIVPVVYAGFIYGPRGGFITLAIVTLVMLPRACFLSASPPDAVLEVIIIAVVSSLIILWFSGQRQEKERRLEVLSRLELARQELAAQVEIIKKSERRRAVINDVCAVVAQSLSMPHLLEVVLDKVVEEMAVDAAMIFLKDEKAATLELVAHKGVSEGFARAVAALRVGEGFNGRVAELGEPMVVENSARDPRLAVPDLLREALHSQLIVPLQAKGVTIGTICVAVRSSRSFSLDDKHLLTAIGSQAGMAIENARLYHEALTSEQKYRDLFENATVSIFVQDLAGAITAANKACHSLTGYPVVEELLGLDVARLFPPPALATLAEVQQALLRGEARPEPYDIQLRKRDGSEAILSLSTRLVAEHSQPQGFQHIAIDVTERRRMRATLNHYVRQILTAQEEERKRIARELHDDTAQSLLLTLQRLDGLSYGPHKRLAQPFEQELEEIRSVVLRTLANVRRLTRDLRPQILDDLGLVAALEWLAEDVERRSGIKTTVQVHGSQPQLSPEGQLLLFRVAQEALANVRRHSAATTARVVLEFAGEKVWVTIEDDGKGFAVPRRLAELADGNKLGLLGMAERARLVGGSIDIVSAPGHGTKIVVELGASAEPLPVEAAENG